jgi:hypothetical protein
MYYIGEKAFIVCKKSNTKIFIASSVCCTVGTYLHTNYQSHQKIHRILSLTDRLSTVQH